MDIALRLKFPMTLNGSPLIALTLILERWLSDCTKVGSVETSSSGVRSPKSDSPTACGTSSQGPERPLECYAPQDYAAVLEGTLLINGNLEARVISEHLRMIEECVQI